jgi:heme-degrading monooxygenase HmoA
VDNSDREHMIARIWSAHTTPAQAPVYAAHLQHHVLPELRGLDGYAGAVLLQREVAQSVEILVITWWRSLAAIRGFAGTDLDRAVVADEARAVLTQFDRRVRHYEVVVQDTPTNRSPQP